ncbi:MAG: hypothetical protein ABF723_05190 [Lentilactobacillus hilgardii]|uniref:hypothetical protein n=1 Tax=Lentilactobacillus hilgardii TaxID=1588 RepID=UPI0039E83D7B
MISRAEREYEYWADRREREYYFRDTDDQPMETNEYYWQVGAFDEPDYIFDETESINNYLAEEYGEPESMTHHQAMLKFREDEPYAKLVQYLGDCQVGPVPRGHNHDKV